jgi:hypothetical protein
MLWRACNLFAALVVVCVFVWKGGERKVNSMRERAGAKTFLDVACMYDEARRRTRLIRGRRFHR